MATRKKSSKRTPRRRKSTASGSGILAQVRGELKHTEFEWKPREYFDTGSQDLNEILGHREKGLPFGVPIELAGRESAGKSALALTLAGMMQQKGVFVLWMDFENSFTDEWALKRGLDPSNNFLLMQTYEGEFPGESEPRLIHGSELCLEMEKVLMLLHRSFPQIMVVFDSLQAIVLPEQTDEKAAGFKVNQALPTYLSKRFPVWASKFRGCNVLPILINQMRQNPMAMFSNPWYTPGGNAKNYYYHARVQVARAKGGRLMHMKRQIGIQGVMKNTKNKSGGVEGLALGYKIYFDGTTEFLDTSELKRASKSDED